MLSVVRFDRQQQQPCYGSDDSAYDQYGDTRGVGSESRSEFVVHGILNGNAVNNGRNACYQQEDAQNLFCSHFLKVKEFMCPNMGSDNGTRLFDRRRFFLLFGYRMKVNGLHIEVFSICRFGRLSIYFAKITND